jgi:hypothetical protein
MHSRRVRSFLVRGGERTKGQLFHKNGRAPMRSGPSSRQDLMLVMVAPYERSFQHLTILVEADTLYNLSSLLSRVPGSVISSS